MDEYMDFTIDDSDYAANAGDSNSYNMGDYNFTFDETPTDPWAGMNQNNVPNMYDPTFGLESDQFQTMSPEQWQTPDMGFGGVSPFEGMPTNTNWNPNSGMSFSNMLGGASKGLNSIFPALNQAVVGQQRGNESQLAPWLKLLGLGGAAMMERKGQQQMSQAAPQAVGQVAQRADPFAAERARYMQELQGSQDRLNQFRQDPNSNAQYAAMRDAAMHRIDRLGAKQGQRFAPQATNPALVEALTNSQMQIEKQMQADRQGLYQPSGANVNPWSGGLEALLQGNKYGAQADSFSPLFNALGFASNYNQNQSNQTDSQNRINAFLAKNGF